MYARCLRKQCECTTWVIMDPLTQATLGAAAAATFCRSSETRHAVVIGALAAAAPDLDVMIRSDTDPLLVLEYHRHFTHSIFIAPFIGFIVAALFKGLFFRKPWPFRRLLLFAVVATLTHGLLDACTSYGTLLYWPFHGHRESWDIISIIDPIFTLPLVIFTVLSFILRRPLFTRIALLLCASYLCLGFYQRRQAYAYAQTLAISRGHHVECISVRPSFGNIALWRLVYRSGQTYFVDALRTLPFTEDVLYPGSKVTAFTGESAREELLFESQQDHDVKRFRFFSQDYVYYDPQQPNIIGDLRYSMFPDSIQPIWGIRLYPNQPNKHVSFEYFRETNTPHLARLFRMIQGKKVSPID